MSLSIFSSLKHFSSSEFSRPDLLNKKLLYKIDSARSYFGHPIYINSDYRPSDPSLSSSSLPQSSHSSGLALDISCHTSHNRFHLVEALLKAGFIRIGLYPSHIHIDVDTNRPSPVLFLGTYHSKNKDYLCDADL